MKVTKVSYGITRPIGSFANDKVGIEIELDENETEQEALDYARMTV